MCIHTLSSKGSLCSDWPEPLLLADMMSTKLLWTGSIHEQGSQRLEKYLNLEDFLEKSLKIKSALKSTGKSLKSLENSLNSTVSVGLSMLIET